MEKPNEKQTGKLKQEPGLNTPGKEPESKSLLDRLKEIIRHEGGEKTEKSENLEKPEGLEKPEIPEGLEGLESLEDLEKLEKLEELEEGEKPDEGDEGDEGEKPGKGEELEAEIERLKRELAEARAAIEEARAEGEKAGRNARIEELLVREPSDGLPSPIASSSPASPLDSIFSLAAAAR